MNNEKVFGIPCGVTSHEIVSAIRAVLRITRQPRFRDIAKAQRDEKMILGADVTAFSEMRDAWGDDTETVVQMLIEREQRAVISAAVYYDDFRWIQHRVTEIRWLPRDEEDTCLARYGGTVLETTERWQYQGPVHVSRDLARQDDLFILGVLAHELGHAATRYEDYEARSVDAERSRELCADYYADVRWGFHSPIRRVQQFYSHAHHCVSPGETVILGDKWRRVTKDYRLVPAAAPVRSMRSKRHSRECTVPLLLPGGRRPQASRCGRAGLETGKGGAT